MKSRQIELYNETRSLKQLNNIIQHIDIVTAIVDADLEDDSTTTKEGTMRDIT